MKDSVTKLILKILLVEQLLDSLVDDWVLEDLVDVWPLVWILLEHALQKVWDVLSKVTWKIWVLANYDLLSELMKRFGVERWLKCAHFVQQHAQRPDI